jgi:hypothetical protein
MNILSPETSMDFLPSGVQEWPGIGNSENNYKITIKTYFLNLLKKIFNHLDQTSLTCGLLDGGFSVAFSDILRDIKTLKS